MPDPEELREEDEEQGKEEETKTGGEEESEESPGLQPGVVAAGGPAGGAETGTTAKKLSSNSQLLRSTSEVEDAALVHDDLEDNITELVNSKKIHLLGRNGDSTEMTLMKGALISLVDIFYQKMPSDSASVQRGIGEVLERYRKAIIFTEGYINHIEEKQGGKHHFGKKRLNLSRQVFKQLSTERRMFSASAKALVENKEEGESFSWRDALKQTRGKKLNLKGSNVEIVGAGSSRIYKLTEDDGKSTYVKPEERMAQDVTDIQAMAAMYRNISPETADFLNYIEEVGAKYVPEGTDTEATTKSGEKSFMMDMYSSIIDCANPIIDPMDSTGKKRSKKDLEEERVRKKFGFLKDSLNGPVARGVYATIAKDPTKHAIMVDFVDFLAKKRTEAEAAGDFAQVAGGSTVSDRNVSSYRLADRLGQGDIMAKSETIQIQDEFGRTVRANAMEGVDGMDYNEALEYASDNKKKLTFTPNSLTQYNNLCILDLMAGQIDRHGGNFKVQIHEDDEFVYIDSIKGIDNDAAFGMLSMDTVEKGRVEKLFAIYNAYKRMSPENIQSIRFISEDFYHRIMDYSNEMIEYDQIDLRSKEEIEALKKRIDAVKQTLRILYNSGKLRLVKTDQEMLEAYNESKGYFAGLEAQEKGALKDIGVKGGILESVR